jgi:hypothetical protein
MQNDQFRYGFPLVHRAPGKQVEHNGSQAPHVRSRVNLALTTGRRLRREVVRRANHQLPRGSCIDVLQGSP